MDLRLTRRLLLGGVLATPALPARAAWPDRPVRLVHGFGPGGNPDIIGRIMAARLSELLGQSFVVEPRPGASGIPASEMVARSRPDGHALVILTGGHGVSAAITARLPFDPVRDFGFVSMLTEFPLMLATRPDHPAAGMAEMIALARSRSRPMFWGSGGGRSTTQGLSGELLNIMAETEIAHVPYQGVAGAHADLLAGRLDFLLETPITLLPPVQQGRMRALAVTSLTRYPPLPDVPTMQESGLRGYEATSWLGIAGPAGLPADVVARLNAACAAVLAEPEPAARLRGLGNVVRHSSPEEFRGRVAADVAKWTEVVIRAQIERG